MTRSTQVEISSPRSVRPRFAFLLFLSMQSGSTQISLRETEQAGTSTRYVHLWPQMLHLLANDALSSFLERNSDTGCISWREILRNGDSNHSGHSGTAHHRTFVPVFAARHVVRKHVPVPVLTARVCLFCSRSLPVSTTISLILIPLPIGYELLAARP